MPVRLMLFHGPAFPAKGKASGAHSGIRRGAGSSPFEAKKDAGTNVTFGGGGRGGRSKHIGRRMYTMRNHQNLIASTVAAFVIVPLAILFSAVITAGRDTATGGGAGGDGRGLSGETSSRPTARRS